MCGDSHICVRKMVEVSLVIASRRSMMKLTFQISGLAEISTIKPAAAYQVFLLISARAYKEKAIFSLFRETHLLKLVGSSKIPFPHFGVESSWYDLS